MTADAITQLIQRIMSQLSQQNAGAATTQGYKLNLLAQVDNAIGVAANFAQVLSVGLAAGSVTGGYGFAVVLAISLFMAALSILTGSGSTDGQALQQLYTAILDTENVAITNYWTDKRAAIQSLWSPLQVDLENIANEGFGQWMKGPSNLDVTENANHFLGDAEQFVNLFIPALNVADGADYWQRPYVQSLQFSAQNVPYGGEQTDLSGWSMAWYGNLPQPQRFFSGGSSLVFDPGSMLPFLVLGINSYLTMIALLNEIEPSEPTFLQYLNEFQGIIAQYANWLYIQYQKAVYGLVKCDIPSPEDVNAFLAYNEYRFLGSYEIVDLPQPSPFAYWPNNPKPGYAWNGVYGVVDEYGFYPSPVAIPSSSPWHLLDIVKTDSLVASFTAYNPYPYLWEATLRDWIHPWIQNKLILGLMARWKAIYLINGYDKVWSVLQSLGALLDQSPPATLTLPQDGTMASGNWSARELCGVLNLEGYMADFLPGGSLTSVWGAQPNVVYGYSLFALVQCLENIANGNWVGPQAKVLGTPIQGLSRPVSLRDRLAAAAV